MNNQLTVLIPTSPIPCHPSTEILDETIANIRKYTDAEIIIMCDGVHPKLEHRRKDYEEYIRMIQEVAYEYGKYRVIVHQEHKHQAIMTREALALVDTPLIMFCEHDCSPIMEIPFNDICNVVERTPGINYMRFNIFHTILEEHEYLMLGSEDIAGIKFRRTVQFSARPHIARTDWYREILTKYFKPEDKTMIEDVMHGVVIEGHKIDGTDFGLGIYTPDGNQLRSYHSDGRGNDEKITYG